MSTSIKAALAADGSALPTQPMPSPYAVTSIGRLGRWDLAGILLAAMSLVAASFLATRRNPFFWYDELATWNLVSDPSALHMVRAIAHGAENNPPLYELLLRLWAAVFHSGEFSLRVSTTVCFVVGIAFIWVTLRGVFRTRAVAIGLGAAVFGSQAVLDELAQARFYGLFALATAFAIGVYVRLAQRKQVSFVLLTTNFAVHVLLLYAHLFGGFYSGAILVSLVAVDFTQRRVRWAVYASFVLAWCVFLPWIPATLHQALMAQPRSWLVKPGIADLFRLVARQTLWLPFAVVVIGALTGIERFVATHPSRIINADDQDQQLGSFAVLTIGVAFIAVVPLIFLFSRLSVPVFYPRYLIPSAWGWALLVAYVADVTSFLDTRSHAPPGKRRVAVGAAWGLVFLILTVSAPANAALLPRSDRPGVVLSPALGTLPIAVEDAFQFWPAYHYDRDETSLYRYPLDSALALDSANSNKAMVEYKLMQLYQREGYIKGAVVDGSDFLCSTPRFIVVDSPNFLWFERRIAGNSDFMTELLGTDRSGATVRLVTRVARCAEGSGPPPASVTQRR